MTLLEEITQAYEDDEEFNFRDHEGVNCLVRGSIIGQGRWTTYYSYIYERDNEYVEVVESQGSTEMQEGDYEPPDIYQVYPYEVTVTKYSRTPLEES